MTPPPQYAGGGGSDRTQSKIRSDFDLEPVQNEFAPGSYGPGTVEKPVTVGFPSAANSAAWGNTGPTSKTNPRGS